MMNTTALRPTLLALALSCAFPAVAQSNAEVLNELQRLARACQRAREQAQGGRSQGRRRPQANGA